METSVVGHAVVGHAVIGTPDTQGHDITVSRLVLTLPTSGLTLDGPASLLTLTLPVSSLEIP